MPHVLFVIGSLREKSFNRQLANALLAELEGKAECRELSDADRADIAKQAAAFLAFLEG